MGQRSCWGGLTCRLVAIPSLLAGKRTCLETFFFKTYVLLLDLSTPCLTNVWIFVSDFRLIG